MAAFDPIAFAMGKAGASRDLVSALMGGNAGGGGGSGTLESSGWVKELVGTAAVSGDNVDMPSGNSSTAIVLFPKGADKFAKDDELVIAITVNSVSARLQTNPNNLNDKWSSATGLFRSRNRSILFTDSTGSDVLTWNFTADSTQGLKINPTNNSGTSSSSATANFDITGIKYNGELIFGKV